MRLRSCTDVAQVLRGWPSRHAGSCCPRAGTDTRFAPYCRRSSSCRYSVGTVFSLEKVTRRDMCHSGRGQMPIRPGRPGFGSCLESARCQVRPSEAGPGSLATVTLAVTVALRLALHARPGPMGHWKCRRGATPGGPDCGNGRLRPHCGSIVTQRPAGLVHGLGVCAPGPSPSGRAPSRRAKKQRRDSPSPNSLSSSFCFGKLPPCHWRRQWQWCVTLMVSDFGRVAYY